MFKSYLKIALRNLARHKLYTSVNIFGLMIGLAVCLIMIGFITYELSFEDSHKNKNRIYRVNGQYKAEDTEINSARIMGALGGAMADEIPEVEKAAIFRVMGNAKLGTSDNSLETDSGPVHNAYDQGGNVICANPDFLEVFTFPLLQGNPKTVLIEPFSVLVTEDVVKENFHGLNPIGQVIKLNELFECQITGILKNVPNNTQLHCDFIISYSSLKRIDESTGSWDQFDKDYVYILLGKGVEPATVEKKIPALLKKYVDPEEADRYAFELQPLKDIYFSSFASNRMGELYPNGEASVLYAWSIMAAFILILAISNFINLATARSADRMREVGVRKVLGALRKQLIKQFLGESFLITIISMAGGMVIYEVFKMIIIPYLPREMLASFYNNTMALILLAALVISVGLLAGFYPALYLSRFKPIAILGGKTSFKSSKSILRKSLVIFQFIIAITLTTCTVIMYNQIHYLITMDLGFEQNNILVLDFEGDRAAEDCHLMKAGISRDNLNFSATINDSPPGRTSYKYYSFYTDNALENDPLTVSLYKVDYDFIPTFDLQIIQGRRFSEDISSGIKNAIIINESLAKALEVDNPIGAKLYRKDGVYEVIGIARDFLGTRLDYGYHFYSALIYKPDSCQTLCVKLPADDISGSIAAMQNIWAKTITDTPFTYKFLDEEIKSQYSEYGSMGMTFLSLSFITLLIACLGIFALVSFTAQQRTKEIGIRKVLGATVSGIVTLLSKEFAILIVIANVIAWPIAYLMMNNILNNFAFRADIGPLTFMFAGLIVFSLALLFAGFQAFRSACADPVSALRHE